MRATCPDKLHHSVTTESEVCPLRSPSLYDFLLSQHFELARLSLSLCKIKTDSLSESNSGETDECL